MKPFISTKFYGVINWAVVFLLLLTPWNYGAWHPGFYTVGGAALFLPLFFGWLQFIMAVFSNNPHGFIKQFPMRMHLFLDIVMGSFLIASPFIFQAHLTVFWPHVLIGALLCIGGIFTEKSPYTTPYEPSHPLGQLHSTDSLEGRLDH
jgi:hypothetical protein